jgi:predicted O-methyltransferase YrrM
MKELFWGYYATRIYLPLSSLSRLLRRFSHQLRGKHDRFLQSKCLPQISWKHCANSHLPRIWEHRKENGNVRISELGIISALAADCEDGANLFEMGTFDGRTTLNLALNSAPRCRVYTLDLPPDLKTRFEIAAGERHMIDKPKPGSRIEKFRSIHPGATAKIHQLLDDSAAFDFAPYENSCSLVFVDGSHAYDYAKSDTRAAMNLAKAGGVILWHDYGIWEGVTKALEELEQREGHGLRNIRGTSLVYWKKK